MGHRILGWMVRLMRERVFRTTNTFSVEQEEKEEITSHGHRCIRDIRYGNIYPNSFFDLYLANGGEKRPVIVYIHGGGYAWGDKAGGNPDTGNFGDGWLHGYFETLLDHGFHVAAVNYALAPEYTYPTPLYQIGEAVSHLREREEEFGLDLSQLVFAGSSAGGQLAGQFVLTQLQETYREELGIEAVTAPEHIMAVIFLSALLDCTRFAKTGDRMYDILFRCLGKVYFRCKRLESSKEVRQAGILDKISDGFPPCYLSDGNRATFDAQAKELAKKLEHLGIRYDFCYHEAEETALPHGYETSLSVWARDNSERQAAFLKTCIRRQDTVW